MPDRLQVRAAESAGGARKAGERVDVVVATRDRRRSLLATLARLAALPERPRVVVVDNDSSDGTAAAVERAHPEVELVRLDENRAATARNVGVQRARAPYVAFSDDDSWWEPFALARAVGLLDAHPRVALLAARILVGDDGKLDATCVDMARSPLDGDGALPGPAVLGFVGCGAVVRRSAFLGIGGFSPRLAFVGEERLLAVDLAAAGWACAYAPEVVARHHPSPRRDDRRRRRLAVRNELWFSWLRLGAGLAARRTLAVAAEALRDADGRRGLASALRGLPGVLGERRRVPAHVERELERLRSR